MLYYGNIQNVQDQCFVLSFISFDQNYRRWDLIPPNNAICKSSEWDFDVVYMHYIMDNDIVFIEFFQIIQMLYRGIDVYLITIEQEWCDSILESLLKLIQQRYGYNAIRVNCIDDIIYSNVSQFDPIYGVKNYDDDNERFEYLVKELNR